MKKIRWIFPIIIIIMAFVLWRVYLQMPQPSLPVVPDPQQVQIADLKTQVDQLQTQVNQSTQLFTLPEVYYYLNTANLHLFILKDVKTALQIMQWVQNRLKTVSSPLVLQETLAADIADLQAAAVPHVNYINQKINDSLTQISTLPLRPRQALTTPEQPTTTSNWQAALAKTWGELKSLIRIQPRNTSMDYVLFDETILRETVRVELQRANIAAVLGQTDLYQASLQQALIALQQFFAPDDPGVLQVINTLQSLTDQIVVADIPNATRALTWLQAQEQQGNL